VLGNECIRGQWQHVRHYQGKGNPRDVVTAFHTVNPKGQFDALHCACLPCCPEGDSKPQPNGKFYGWTNQFQLCNPDDHRICGPAPRPAPANALIWTGIGIISQATDTGPGKQPDEYVIIRVYIEDRSEPGGGHPGGAIEPADVYCFQAWRTGLTTTKKPDYSTIYAAFRSALAEQSCAWLQLMADGDLPIGSLPPTSVTFNGGSVSADITDCGPLHDGNRQIHPSTSAPCTTNP